MPTARRYGNVVGPSSSALLVTLYFFSFVLIFIDAARHVRRVHDVLVRKE